MPETNFFQSWAFWFLAGIVIGFALGFILAIIMAASSKGSRMEEKIEKDVFRADVPPFETPKEIAEREKRKIAYLKMRGIIVAKNDPRTD